ncbi:tetratricopeptide repeat protein [bacterium]|nr:tetratricopeptide repeat protein [bacterium]
MMDQGDLKTAATHFQKVIRLNPKDADAHSNLGLVQKRQGKVEEAIDQLSKSS